MNKKENIQNHNGSPEQNSGAGRLTQSAECPRANASDAFPSTDNTRSGSIQPSTNPTIRRPRRPRAPYHHRNHRRTGKVARLPSPIRREVCLMFTRYAEYKDITAWLASQGYPNISQSNLSRWRKGGFQDWLVREQEKRVDFITMAFDVLTALIKHEKNAAAASSSNGRASVPASPDIPQSDLRKPSP